MRLRSDFFSGFRWEFTLNFFFRFSIEKLLWSSIKFSTTLFSNISKVFHSHHKSHDEEWIHRAQNEMLFLLRWLLSRRNHIRRRKKNWRKEIIQKNCKIQENAQPGESERQIEVFFLSVYLASFFFLRFVLSSLYRSSAPLLDLISEFHSLSPYFSSLILCSTVSPRSSILVPENLFQTLISQRGIGGKKYSTEKEKLFSRRICWNEGD